MNEEERIRLAYSKRESDGALYSFFNAGHLFLSQQLEKELIRLFRRYGMNPIGNKKILDVGCGTGWYFRKLIDYGARAENLFGIDLLPKAIEEAKRISPDIHFRCGNAQDLPFGDECFDIVSQFTMFTSILVDSMKRNVASEMRRVLESEGLIVWYDYFVSKPTNPNVKGIGKREIISLFPGCTFDFRKVTLAPPVARAIAPHSFLLCYLLEKIPWLRTHYLVVIKRAAG